MKESMREDSAHTYKDHRRRQEPDKMEESMNENSAHTYKDHWRRQEPDEMEKSVSKNSAHTCCACRSSVIPCEHVCMCAHDGWKDGWTEGRRDRWSGRME